MARVKGAMMTRKHRKKILGLAKGYWGNKSRHYKMANQQMMKSGRCSVRAGEGCPELSFQVKPRHPDGWRGFSYLFFPQSTCRATTRKRPFAVWYAQVDSVSSRSPGWMVMPVS